ISVSTVLIWECVLNPYFVTEESSCKTVLTLSGVALAILVSSKSVPLGALCHTCTLSCTMMGTVVVWSVVGKIGSSLLNSGD
ncbi:hypothetical protein FCV25MIE_09165, partial [Fagus crenata]